MLFCVDLLIMQPTVVTILSTNFAGSHFLSLLLGSHSKSIHLGEIRRLADGMRSRRQACWYCDPPERCPIVRNIRPREIGSIYRTIYANLVEDGLEKWAFIDTSKEVSWAKRSIGNEEFRFKYVYLVRDPRRSFDAGSSATIRSDSPATAATKPCFEAIRFGHG